MKKKESCVLVLRLQSPLLNRDTVSIDGFEYISGNPVSGTKNRDVNERQNFNKKRNFFSGVCRVLER
jgi:hypothetical protein